MIGAVTLAAALHECDQIPHAKYAQRILPPFFGKIFWSRQNKRTKSIWEQFKHEDYGWNTTIPAKGEDLSQGAFMRWYTRNLFSVASKVSVRGDNLLASLTNMSRTTMLRPSFIIALCSLLRDPTFLLPALFCESFGPVSRWFSRCIMNSHIC